MPEGSQSAANQGPMGEESPRLCSPRSASGHEQASRGSSSESDSYSRLYLEPCEGEGERPVSLVSTLSSGSSRDSHSLYDSTVTLLSSSTPPLPSEEDIDLELSPPEGAREPHSPKLGCPRGEWREHCQSQSNNSKVAHRRGATSQNLSSPVAIETMAPNPKLTHVDRVIMEIIETERMYVRDLRSIVEDYLAHIIDVGNLPIRPEQVCALFGNIEDIYEFNSELLQSLDMCENDPVSVARCFVDKSDYFEIYTQYCTNYPNSVAALTDCMRSKTLAKFFRERQASLRLSLPLGSYLLKPVQRILKYHLLLQEIAKHYDQEEEEEGYDVVQEAIETMTGVAWYINDMKRKHEHAVRLQEIQSLLINWKGPDLTTYGELVLEGTFHVHRAKNTRTLFLFDKMLIITKRRGEHYIYKTHISCSTLMLLDSAKDPLHFSVIHFKHPKQPHTVQAKTVEEKRLWAHHIKRLILENHHTIVPQKAKEAILEMDSLHPWKNRYSPERLKKTLSCQHEDFPAGGRHGRRRSEPSKQLRRTTKAMLKEEEERGDADQEPTLEELRSITGKETFTKQVYVEAAPLQSFVHQTRSKEQSREDTSQYSDSSASPSLPPRQPVAETQEPKETWLVSREEEEEESDSSALPLETSNGSIVTNGEFSEEEEGETESHSILPSFLLDQASVTGKCFNSSHSRRGSLASEDLISLASHSPQSLISLASPSPQSLISLASPSPQSLISLASEDLISLASPPPQDLISLASPSPQDLISLASPSPQDLTSLASPSPQDLISLASPSPQDLISLASPSPQDLISLASPSPQPSTRDSSKPSHSIDLQEKTQKPDESFSKQLLIPEENFSTPAPGTGPSPLVEVERRSTLSRQDRLLIHKIRKYYEYAEHQDANFSIKRRESLSYIPTGLVRQLSKQLNGSPQDHTLHLHRKASAHIRPTSWSVFDLPGLEADQRTQHGGLDPQDPVGPKSRSQSIIHTPTGSEEFRPSSEMAKVWRDMETGEPLGDQQLEEEVSCPGPHLPQIDSHTDQEEPLRIQEESDTGSVSEEPFIPLSIMPSPAKKEVPGLDTCLSKPPISRERGRLAQAPLPRIISLRSGVEEDMIMQDMEKVKNKVFQLARQYSQRIKNNRPLVRQRNREAENLVTPKNLPAVSEENGQGRDRGNPKLMLSLNTYEQVLIQDLRSPSPSQTLSSEGSSRVTSPCPPLTTSPLSPAQAFHWPDVRELRSMYTPHSRLDARVSNSYKVGRSCSFPESMQDSCSEEVTSSWSSTDCSFSCNGSTDSHRAPSDCPETGMDMAHQGGSPVGEHQAQPQSQAHLCRWSSLDHMLGTLPLHELQYLQEPMRSCYIAGLPTLPNEHKVIIVERVPGGKPGDAGKRDEDGESKERDKPEDLESLHKVGLDCTKKPMLTSGKKTESSLVKNLRERFQSLSS